MNRSRRRFLRAMGVAGLSVPTIAKASANTKTPTGAGSTAEQMGVLVDLPMCIGCRKCEYACQEAAGFDVAPLETFEDKSVFAEFRRPRPDSYTVVNAFTNPSDVTKPIHVKTNCMHCNEPACVSACLVGAFRKESNGAVVYDAWKCMGCRYCMVACPFQIPTYDYDEPLVPEVRKCNLCAHKLKDNGGVPSCVKICPQECLIYGRRNELLQIAREKIRARPDYYVDHVYGENEAGGTSWLYISSVQFEKLGFPALASSPPPHLTETIQHAVFKGWIPPLALFGLLATAMWLTRSGERCLTDEAGPQREVEASQDEHREDAPQSEDGGDAPQDGGATELVAIGQMGSKP